MTHFGVPPVLFTEVINIYGLGTVLGVYAAEYPVTELSFLKRALNADSSVVNSADALILLFMTYGLPVRAEAVGSDEYPDALPDILR